jgi:type II secretory pathway component PulF
MTKKTTGARFIEAMAELSQSKVVPAVSVQALASIQEMPLAVKAAASEISAMLLSGYRLSSALAACTAADFSSQDISLVQCAEETGNFSQAFRFMTKAKKRREQGGSRLAVSAVYPLFIVLLVFAGSAAVLFCADMLLPLSPGAAQSPAYRGSLRLGIGGGAVFLCAVTAGFVYAAKRVLEDAPLSSAFLLLDFLCSAGVDLPRAVNCAVSGISANSKLAAAFIQTQEDLQNGIPLLNAFLPIAEFSPVIRYHLALSALGGKSEGVFSQIAAVLDERDENRRALFARIAEPMMLLSAGVYMLILLQTAIMPLITNYGGLI